MPNTSQEQAERRRMLRELLQNGPAATQQTLVNALNVKGFTATQSSVSRDLRELGAIKTSQGYELPEAPQSSDELRAATDFLRQIAPAGPNLLVIRTAIGAAQRVALALDRSGWPEMIGNIGGDDTVFVATNSAAAQKRVLAKIEQARGND